MHIHVMCGDGEAKYWLEPAIELATSSGLSRSQLKETKRLVEEHQHEFKGAWEKHFGG